MKTKWWFYSQNNPGGSFEFTDKLSHYMIIEACSASHADLRLEELGGYFDGCDNGTDCSCCGDRWSRAYGEGDSEPAYYGTPLDKAESIFTWRNDGRGEIFVVPLEGPAREHIVKKSA